MSKRSLFEWVTWVLLVLVLVGALEIAEWLVLITSAPVPFLGRNMPYLAPCIVAILGFNLAVSSRLPPRPAVLPLDLILFALFVVALFAIEFGHALDQGESLDIWLQMAFFWMFVCYAALRSFEGYLPRCREKIVVATIAAIFATGFADVLFAVVLAEGWESAPLGLEGRQLFNSAYIGYLSVFGLALVVFDLPSGSYKMILLRYAVLAPFFAWVAYVQRLGGPVLLILAILGLKVLSLLRRRSHQVAVVICAWAVLVAWAVVVMPTDSNPTVSGLRQGPFLLDESKLFHGDIISSYIRRETIVRELRLFLTSPLVGVGMIRASEVKVLFFGMHSSLLYVLVASGLIGYGLLAAWLGWTVRQGWRFRGLAALALPGIVVAMMFLQTDPVWWWAIAAYLIAAPDERVGA